MQPFSPRGARDTSDPCSCCHLFSKLPQRWEERPAVPKGLGRARPRGVRVHSSGLASLRDQQQHKKLCETRGPGDSNCHLHPSRDTAGARAEESCSSPVPRQAAGVSQLLPVGSEQSSSSSSWIYMFLIILIKRRDVPRWRPDSCCCHWEAEPCLLAVITLLHCLHPQSDRTQY